MSVMGGRGMLELGSVNYVQIMVKGLFLIKKGLFVNVIQVKDMLALDSVRYAHL